MPERHTGGIESELTPAICCGGVTGLDVSGGLVPDACDWWLSGHRFHMSANGTCL
ncbi:hypothetical protein D3OALGB2SA_5082 [Olavius algarvensis associated proteobacterium Delta 3]|nr:hypothetical protein D3OALGB2SA_5082 [Olavius algarvensis associated proteobacterium Delta 3]